MAEQNMLIASMLYDSDSRYLTFTLTGEPPDPPEGVDSSQWSGRPTELSFTIPVAARFSRGTAGGIYTTVVDGMIHRYWCDIVDGQPRNVQEVDSEGNPIRSKKGKR